MSNFGKFFAGAIIGGAVGAAFGMLLAPRSGAETRALIREELESRTRQAGDALKDQSDILKEKASAFREKIGDIASEFEETGRRTINKVTERRGSTGSKESAT